MKTIARNIGIVTAIFMMTLSIMLISNYFQAKDVSPLQTQVVETLKQLNDQHANNVQLQEQIRQLDLMARKAYFVNMDHLMRGVYLLLGMLVVFIVSIRVYFAGYKDIPNKEIDPIDEWVIKSQARKYVGLLATGVTAIALLFVVFSLPFMQASNTMVKDIHEELPFVSGDTTEIDTDKSITEETNLVEHIDSLETIQEAEVPTMLNTDPVTDPVTAITTSVETEAPEKTVQNLSTPKVTSNAFRGNYANGITQAKNIPIKWNLQGGNNIAWKTKIPRGGQNSPIIHGNKVFITGADAQARELYCYDLNTGKLQWTLAAKDIPGSPAQVPKTTKDTGLASASVSTNGQQVCAIFATGDVICANMEGKQLWVKNLGVPDNHYGYASSLLVFKNRLFIQYDNRNTHELIALNTENGAELWRKERADKIAWSSPTIAYVNKQPQLILMSDPSITAYNPTTGEQLWRVECLTGEVGASACSANGIIFGASEYAKMVAINGTNGTVLWESMDYLPEASSPVATADNLYLATSYGVVASFDVKTGKLKKVHETGEEFYSSPMLADGKIFLFSNAGKMQIFSADDEFKLLNSFDTGEKTYATPAFTDGRIVVRTDQSIYCVKAN